jgi:tetraacyldisaccharide 4'-kinase
MWTPGEFRELVSGRRRGAAPTVMRGLLRAAEAPYRLAVRWRNVRYDRGRAVVHRAGVPVVSVGNLTLGGTGKTPLVKWLARWFTQRGRRVAIVSRGYGSKPGRPNDEALELAAALSGAAAGLPSSAGPSSNVPHIQNPDRVAAARSAIAEHGCDLILLDDGFQHRRLARDLDIVLLDALEPFGFDHVFPRGTLREPAVSLGRADVICLSRSDVISESQRSAIRSRVARLAPHAVWCELAHSPTALLNAAGESQPLDTLAGRRVLAFCGLGNPAAFRHTLASTGCQIAAWREFADHHVYTPADIADLAASAARVQADMLVCTHKDLVKIDHTNLAGRPLCAVMIEIAFLTGRDDFEKKGSGLFFQSRAAAGAEG